MIQVCAFDCLAGFWVVKNVDVGDSILDYALDNLNVHQHV